MVRPGTDRFSAKYLQISVKHPDSVMVWGSFRYYGGKKDFYFANERDCEREPPYEAPCLTLLGILWPVRVSVGTEWCTSKLIKDWLE